MSQKYSIYQPSNTTRSASSRLKGDMQQTVGTLGMSIIDDEDYKLVNLKSNNYERRNKNYEHFNALLFA